MVDFAEFSDEELEDIEWEARLSGRSVQEVAEKKVKGQKELVDW